LEVSLWIRWLTLSRKARLETTACQKTDGHAQAYGVTRQGIRATRRKLNCLKSNPQKVQLHARRKDA
jgi:hypothetical protein